MKKQLLTVLFAIAAVFSVSAQDYLPNRLHTLKSDDDLERHYFFYDEQNRVSMVDMYLLDVDGIIHAMDSLFYDEAGNISKISTFQYINRECRHVSDVMYTYDANGNRLTRTNYNNFGSGMEIQGVYTYVYDANGRMTSHTMTLVGNDFERCTYEYDANGNLIKEEAQQNSYWDGSGWENSFKVVYAYDANNHVTCIESYGWSNTGWSLTNTRRYTYDAAGNCLSDITYRGNTEVNKYLYTYFDDELVSDYILPVHPEPIFPQFPNFTNKPRWYTWWSIDDNDVLQYICCYHYLFGDPTGVENVAADNQSVVFPNPATTSFNIQNHKICGVEIYSVDGKLVKTDNSHHTNITTVNCNDLENGTYFVKIFDGTRYETQKVVVNK